MEVRLKLVCYLISFIYLFISNYHVKMGMGNFENISIPWDTLDDKQFYKLSYRL